MLCSLGAGREVRNVRLYDPRDAVLTEQEPMVR
jgi:hypothetical protein